MQSGPTTRNQQLRILYAYAIFALRPEVRLNRCVSVRRDRKAYGCLQAMVSNGAIDSFCSQLLRDVSSLQPGAPFDVLSRLLAILVNKRATGK